VQSDATFISTYRGSVAVFIDFRKDLNQIHSATHPAQFPKDKPPVNGSSPDAAELFAALDAEAEEDKEEEETL